MKIANAIICLFVVPLGCIDSKNAQQTSLTASQTMCAAVASDKEWYLTENIAPLFKGLGDVDFPISTANELAQEYFNQGLSLAYGFNHAEAARSFYYATKLDTTCAMAYWGFAYVLGPNYNAGMESDNYERAYFAVQKALSLSKQNGTEKETALIEALAKRYVREPLEDRTQLDTEYSKSMGELFRKYSNDPDIGTLYAESVMNLHPWDLYDKSGEARKWTPEILSTLESVLDKYPDHCGANHFYIHAVEASSNPEKGLRSARIFDDGLAANAGHLVHMSSHIYIRTGDYHEGTVANIKAIKADSAYLTACDAQGVYPLMYFPHNQHFMAGTATLEGNSKWAVHAADEVAKNANRQLMKDPGWGALQHYYTIPFYVYVKFGKWDEILEMKSTIPDLDYPAAVFRYAKGMAYLGKGKVTQAKTELDFLTTLSVNEELREVTIWEINSVYELVQIAEKVLRAAILAEEKNYDQSITLLKEAIKIEDDLNYNEPPDWFFSVRHALGAVLLEAGKNEEAIRVYEEDLKKFPKNGWALRGLMNAHANMNNASEAKNAEAQFKNAWATADIELHTSIIK